MEHEKNLSVGFNADTPFGVFTFEMSFNGNGFIFRSS